jgi:hypothetical protein
MPQASTTMRNRPTAARGDREFIVEVLEAVRFSG